MYKYILMYLFYIVINLVM